MAFWLLAGERRVQMRDVDCFFGMDAMQDRVGQINGANRTQTSVVMSRKIDRRSAVHWQTMTRCVPVSMTDADVLI